MQGDGMGMRGGMQGQGMMGQGMMGGRMHHQGMMGGGGGYDMNAMHQMEGMMGGGGGMGHEQGTVGGTIHTLFMGVAELR